jgi:arylsulfatase
MMKVESGFIKLTAFALATVNGSGQSSFPQKPNILFVTTDYQAGSDVPWETPLLRMPVLAGLSEEGVVLSKHYCTAPISMPSRYTLITGMYPHFHGQWDNQSVWVPDGTPILMEQLQSSGYYTAAVGKMHFFPWDREVGYNKWISADRKGNSAADTVRKDDYARFLGKAGLSRASYLNLQDSGEIYGVYDWPFADSLHIDHFVGEMASDLIAEKKSDPWFLWVSFNGPHNPWDPPARYSSVYKDTTVSRAVWEPGELISQPYDYTILRYNYTRKISDLIDENPEKRDHYVRQIRAGHYGGLTFIDEQIGKIIEALRETGELDNTVIIFTSDHGAHLGDHDLIHKGTHYERSARVPMVIWFGSNLTSGERSGYSSHVDIMPTILEIAGAPIPESLEGKSLLPMIRGEAEGADHAIIEIRKNYSRISDEYIFGLFPATREEVLVDRVADPQELRNVAYDKKYSHVADSLRNLLYNFHPAIRNQMDAGKR